MEVTVTVQNGAETTKEYVIYLIKDDEPMDDVELKQLFANSEEITKEDDGTYTVYVPKSATKVELEAVANYQYSKVNIEDNNYEMGSNTKTVDIGTLETKTVFVKVKSISGKIKQYVVNIVRELFPLLH